MYLSLLCGFFRDLGLLQTYCHHIPRVAFHLVEACLLVGTFIPLLCQTELIVRLLLELKVHAIGLVVHNRSYRVGTPIFENF